jgi:hypothetical protein
MAVLPLWVRGHNRVVARILRSDSFALVRWCPRQDSNLRPSAPERGGAGLYKARSVSGRSTPHPRHLLRLMTPEQADPHRGQ